MRNFLTACLATAGLLAVAAPPLAAQSVKIAYLDSRRVFQEAPGAQEVRDTIEQAMKKFQDQLQVLQDSIQQMIDDYQQKSVTLSPDAKKAREDEIVKKRDAMQQRAAALRQQAEQKQNELMKPVMDRIEKVISDIRREEGYAIIFDAASAAMVSADSTLDLTQKVITKLKADSGSAPTARK